MRNVISSKWSYLLVFALLSGPIPALAAPVFQMRSVVAEGPHSKAPKDAEKMDLVVTNRASGKMHVETFWVSKKVLIDEGDIEKASVRTSTLATSNVPGRPEIVIVFSAEGRKRFAEVTRHSINKRLAIIIDGHIISAPVIKTEVPTGTGIIVGNFTRSEATDLSNKINEAVNK